MAIPMLAVWANLHGGFIVGLAALGIYAGSAILEDLRAGHGLGRGIVLLAIALGGALATLMTPYGLGSWSAVAQTLSSPMTRLAVAEWQPFYATLRETWRESPWALVYFACAIAMFAALCVSVIRTPGEGAAGPAAVAILMAGATVFSGRNMALFVVTAVGPLARRWAAMRGSGAGVPARHPRAGTEAHPTADVGAARQTPAKSAVHPLVAVAAATALAAYTGLFSNRLIEVTPCPAGAVAFMNSHGLHGNILNEYSWGEYLIWHEWPRSRVFIDSRYETAYPKQVMSDYLTFFFDHPGADKVLTSYRHDYVLVPPKSGAYRVTARSRHWKLIYQDPMSTLFAVANSAAAVKLPGLPASGSKPSDLFP